MSDQPAAATPSTRPIAGSRWARRGQQAAAAAAQAKETAEKEEKKDETPTDPAPEETPAENGTSIWGKLRAVTVGNNEENKEEGEEGGGGGGGLWGKLVSATVALTHAEEKPDSDDTDFEGETHVTRVLKEYYKEKGELPDWLQVVQAPEEDEAGAAAAGGGGGKSGGRQPRTAGFGAKQKSYDRNYDDFLPQVHKPSYDDDFQMQQAKKPPKFKSLGSQLKNKPPPGEGGRIDASAEFDTAKKPRGRFGVKS